MIVDLPGRPSSYKEQQPYTPKLYINCCALVLQTTHQIITSKGAMGLATGAMGTLLPKLLSVLYIHLHSHIFPLGGIMI